MSTFLSIFLLLILVGIVCANAHYIGWKAGVDAAFKEFDKILKEVHDTIDKNIAQNEKKHYLKDTEM